MNSNDLIRRRDLLPEAVYYIIADPKEALDELLRRCKTAPAVDAEPVIHAHWELLDGAPFCSNCKMILNGYSSEIDISTTPRCSFCGAKMYGGDNP